MANIKTTDTVIEETDTDYLYKTYNGRYFVLCKCGDQSPVHVYPVIKLWRETHRCK